MASLAEQKDFDPSSVKVGDEFRYINSDTKEWTQNRVYTVLVEVDEAGDIRMSSEDDYGWLLAEEHDSWEAVTDSTLDIVNSPDHYTAGGIETIDFIEAKQLDYHLANAVKYISRAGKKDPAKLVEDLQKAVWYLDRRIGQETACKS